jgi:hypothetical protein
MRHRNRPLPIQLGEAYIWETMNREILHTNERAVAYQVLGFPARQNALVSRVGSEYWQFSISGQQSKEQFPTKEAALEGLRNIDLNPKHAR